MTTMTQSSRYDYLTIGHISRDVVPVELSETGYDIGGTVSFSGRIAKALGCRTAILTSVGPDMDASAAIPDCIVEVVPSAKTTSFSNIYYPEGRKQIVHSLAGWISAEHVPATWRDTPIVHLGPITNQVDPNLVYAFPNSLIGLTPQGWMREWGADGEVTQIPMAHADILLPNADAVIIGVEDLYDPSHLAYLRSLSKLLIMTLSADGCIIFQGDEETHVPTPQVTEVNATGAGDTFATAFFVHLWRTNGNILKSAEFANRIASASVAQPDLIAKVNRIQTLLASE